MQNNEFEVYPQTQEIVEQQSVPVVVTQIESAAPSDLPRGIRIFESLANSFQKVGITLLYISVAGIGIYWTYQWAKGFISTDIYITLIQNLFEFSQNLVIV
ncbi:hypothetical protein ABEV54_11720 [Peribacillus psychrosaccharolyticus]|uniref:hypothetical protein n=1 Tax=Peribacillus psychrosaccharolyticus TaxID=1407 RepID=UPI003D2A66A2